MHLFLYNNTKTGLKRQVITETPLDTTRPNVKNPRVPLRKLTDEQLEKLKTTKETEYEPPEQTLSPAQEKTVDQDQTTKTPKVFLKSIQWPMDTLLITTTHVQSKEKDSKQTNHKKQKQRKKLHR